MAKWTDDTHPWEQQKGESNPAYEAFQTYLNMDRQRSLRAVARELGKSETLIFRWSSRNNWQERIRAYNNYVQREATANAIEQRKKMNERQARLGEQFQLKAFDALRAMSEETIKSLHPIAIKEFLRVGAEIERKARTAQVEDLSTRTEGKEDGSTAGYIIAAYAKRMEDGGGAD